MTSYRILHYFGIGNPTSKVDLYVDLKLDIED